MKALVAFTLVLSISCLGASTAIYITLNAEVKDLEERLQLVQTDNRANEKTPAFKETPDWAPLLEARLFTLEEKLDVLEKARDERAAPKSHSPSPGAILPFAGIPGEGEVGAENSGRDELSPEKKGDLEKKMKELESKLGEVQKRLEEGKKEEKPKFDRFAAKIGLEEHQKEATHEILRRGKAELLEHLQKTLPDGTTMIDEFAEMVYLSTKDPKAAEKKGPKIFMRLFSEKVPGSEKTYIEVIGEMNTRLAEEMRDVMTEEQKQKYDEWAPDASDIDLPDGPINTYLKEYVERRNIEDGR